MNTKVQRIVMAAALFLAATDISAQTLLNQSDEKHTVMLKAGWDQTIVTGLNYSYRIKRFFKKQPTHLQMEFISPIATIFNFSNNRLSAGVQSLFLTKNRFQMTANLLGTYSWSQDVTAKMHGLGIYSSLITRQNNGRFHQNLNRNQLQIYLCF